MTAIRLRMPGSAGGDPKNLGPDEIFVAGRILGRGQARVSVPPFLKRLFLVLAVRQHQITTKSEIAEALWGGDIDGGPDWGEKQIEVGLYALRDAGAALGFRIETRHGRGYQMVTIDSARVAA